MFVPSPRAKQRAVAALLFVVLALLSTVHAQQAPDPDELFTLIEQAVLELPRERFEVQGALDAIAAHGDVTVEAIYSWVRDETGFLPYRGALKGATGVLMDGAGNSLDRTLLLKALLELAGERAIVAHAQLSGDEAATALQALRPAPQRQATATPVDELAARAAAELGMDEQLVKQRLSALAATSEALRDGIDQQAAAQSAALTELLSATAYGAYLNAENGAVQAAQLAALADHWWVQVDVDGSWVDLDPTLRSAQVGDPLTTATIRFDLTDLKLLAAVDGSCRDLSCGDRLHRVRVAVVVETWDGSELSEQEVAATELLAAGGSGLAVAFAAMPTDWPEDLDLFNANAPHDRLREALLATQEWRPALFVGNTSIGSAKVGINGKVGQESTVGGAAGNAGMMGGGIGGMFGGFGSSTAGAAQEEPSAFTALWLEYTVSAAGNFEETYRREVFDLIGPAAREAGVSEVELSEQQRLHRAAALAGQTDIVVTGAALTAEALQAGVAKRVLAKRAEWSDLYYHGAALSPETISERLADTAQLVSPLEQFQQLRGEKLVGFQAGPLVATYHQGFDDDLQGTYSFDLVSGAVSVLEDEAAAQAQLAQGVRDTVIEAAVQKRITGGTESGQVSVAAAFSADLAAGRSWNVVGSAQELDAISPDLPADLRARVLADLAGGHVVMVPPGGAEAVGWWSIDPSTGATLGMGDRGWGQAFSEYVENVNIVLQLRTGLNQYAAMGRCLGLGIAGPLYGQNDPDNREFEECVFNGVCNGVNTALSGMVTAGTNWTNTITMATIDSLWGGVPEAGYGGFCGGLWKKMGL